MSNFIEWLPTLCCCGFFILFVGAMIGIVVYFVNNNKNSSWEGEIVDKLHNQNTNDNGNTVDYYTIVIKKNNGKTMKLGVIADEFNNYQIGDKLIKNKGSLKPEKV